MSSILNATTTSGLVTSADNSGSLQLQTNNGTTAVTIDTSQNVGIGTSSPETKLHVTQSNDALPALQLRHGDGDFILMEEGGGTDLFKFTRVAATNDLQINNVTANNIRFATNNTERMRITSGGRLNIGTTGGSATRLEIEGGETMCAFINTSATDANYKTTMAFTDSGGTTRGTIRVNNSATQYNTSSDYRLKENIAPMFGALAKVQSLKPCTYTWKIDGHEGQGFIAHELAEIFPDAVAGEKDAVETYTDEEGNEQTRPVYQGVDTSFLVATLTAAIQELKAELDATKAEVQALKGVA